MIRNIFLSFIIVKMNLGLVEKQRKLSCNNFVQLSNLYRRREYLMMFAFWFTEFEGIIMFKWFSLQLFTIHKHCISYLCFEDFKIFLLILWYSLFQALMTLFIFSIFILNQEVEVELDWLWFMLSNQDMYV